jgi:hypothetical protein
MLADPEPVVMRQGVLLLMTCAIAVGLTGCGARRSRPHPPAGVEGRAEVVVVQNGKPVAVARGQEKAAVLAPHHGIQWEVDGWGSNQSEAEADALKRAAEKLAGFLQALKPPLYVTLTTNYVRRHLVHGEAQRRPDQEKAVNEAVQLQCWSLPVSITPEDYAVLARNARQAKLEEERSERMRLAAWGVVGMLILVTGMRGSLQLLEWRASLRQATPVRQNRKAAKVKAVAVACLLLAVVMGLFFLA